jgi:hypothetical protein
VLRDGLGDGDSFLVGRPGLAKSGWLDRQCDDYFFLKPRLELDTSGDDGVIAEQELSGETDDFSRSIAGLGRVDIKADRSIIEFEFV